MKISTFTNDPESSETDTVIITVRGKQYQITENPVGDILITAAISVIDGDELIIKPISPTSFVLEIFQ